MFKIQNKGFTLIELLVVIAIIGVLAALVTASINDSRAKSRDAARISQLNELETALELYYLENDTYPIQGTAGLLSGISGDITPDFIRSLPADPLFTTNGCGTAGSSNSAYCYQSANSGQGYAIRTSIEDDGTANCIVSVNYSGSFTDTPCSGI